MYRVEVSEGQAQGGSSSTQPKISCESPHIPVLTFGTPRGDLPDQSKGVPEGFGLQT